LALATDSGGSSGAVHVDLSVEGTLVVDDILHVWDVQASCGYICADHNYGLFVELGYLVHWLSA